MKPLSDEELDFLDVDRTVRLFTLLQELTGAAVDFTASESGAWWRRRLDVADGPVVVDACMGCQGRVVAAVGDAAPLDKDFPHDPGCTAVRLDTVVEALKAINEEYLAAKT